MRHAAIRLALALGLAMCFVSGGCSAAGNDGSARGSAADDIKSDGGSSGATNDGNTGAPEAFTSIAIEPAMAVLDSLDGSRPEQVFSVIGTRSDGTTGQVVDARFSLASLAFGAISETSGRFIATGIAGGETQVIAEIGEGAALLKAEATVRVRFERVVLTPGVTADALGTFAKTPIIDAAPNLVYPLEGAVMPQNVFPADVQWLTGNASDLFELRLEKPNAIVRVLLQHSGPDFGNHYLVDAISWRALAQSDPQSPAVVRLKRWDSASGNVIESPSVNFSFARAALTGSIYYWDIAAGRIIRIDDGTNVGVQFMPTPPDGLKAAPEEAPCVGCHSVSPSGRYMGGRLSGGENIGAVFDLTTDLTTAPAPTLFPLTPSNTFTGSAQWWFSSWSPDEKRMVVSTNEGTATRPLAMLNPFTGVFVPVQGTLPSGTHPAWSPDGKEIAYVANANAWGGGNTTGDIAILPVTAPDSVGPSQIIHTGSTLVGSTPTGNADSYPSWSPDSSRIAFAHGGSSRSEDDPANGFFASSALYLMGRDGGNVVRLDKACGGITTTNNFQPRFAPFDTGEHFWVSFLSRRDYGNAQAGTRGTTRQQIWVAAIRKNAMPGEDPSEVGYWLPGQRTASQNISAFWAPRPCRKDGEGCSVGSECCGGDCRPDAQGALVCAPPPPEECRMLGQTCSTDGDCCAGLLCAGNVCVAPIQ